MADTPAPMLNRLPLVELHVELGARLVPFAGYAMPIQYPAGIVAEHNWTRTSASLFDVSHMGQLTLPHLAALALEALTPADLVGLNGGCLRYSMLLNDDGGILDDLMIARRPGDLHLVVNGAVKAADIAHLRAYGLDPIVHDDLALLALQGPKAVDALARLVPGVAALGFMRAGAFVWNDADLWISRSGYTGEDGFEISLPATRADAFARAVLAEPEVRPAGLGARDSLRLEAGLPLYGQDLTPAITPVEAGLSFAIAKRRRSEGGFPGSERVLAQLFDGPEHRRVGLVLDGRQPVREGARVFSVDGAPVGEVTSGGFGPAIGRPIAMASVAAAHGADGAALTVEARGRMLAATVTPMPFFPKSYVRQGAA